MPFAASSTRSTWPLASRPASSRSAGGAALGRLEDRVDLLRGARGERGVARALRGGARRARRTRPRRGAGARRPPRGRSRGAPTGSPGARSRRVPRPWRIRHSRPRQRTVPGSTSRTIACATKCVTPRSRSTVEAISIRASTGPRLELGQEREVRARRLGRVLGLAAVVGRRRRLRAPARALVQRAGHHLQRVLDRPDVEPEQARARAGASRARRPRRACGTRARGRRRAGRRRAGGGARRPRRPPRGRGAGSRRARSSRTACQPLPSRARAREAGRGVERDHVVVLGLDEARRDHVDHRGREPRRRRATWIGGGTFAASVGAGRRRDGGEVELERLDGGAVARGVAVRWPRRSAARGRPRAPAPSRARRRRWRACRRRSRGRRTGRPARAPAAARGTSGSSGARRCRTPRRPPRSRARGACRRRARRRASGPAGGPPTSQPRPCSRRRSSGSSGTSLLVERVGARGRDQRRARAGARPRARRTRPRRSRRRGRARGRRAGAAGRARRRPPRRGRAGA